MTSRPRSDQRDKLPVPGPWQAPIARAVEHLAEQLDIPRHAVAVTRVAEAAMAPTPATGAGEPATVLGTGEGLDVWLLAAGKSVRYRVALTETPAA